MTDQEQALLRACWQDPSDGTLLIYADFLEESGDRRGELIRVRVRLRQIGPKREVLDCGPREYLGGGHFQIHDSGRWLDGEVARDAHDRSPIRIGDRIDVELVRGLNRRDSKAYGLRVTKLTRDESDDHGVLVYAVKDALSVRRDPNEVVSLLRRDVRIVFGIRHKESPS